MRLERLTTTRRATGPLFCPRCCWRLGRAESPAIGYLTRCGGCKRALMIREGGDGDLVITLTVSDARDDAVYLDLTP